MGTEAEKIVALRALAEVARAFRHGNCSEAELIAVVDEQEYVLAAEDDDPQRDAAISSTASEPRYPPGTPEYDAYAAELRAELDKLAHGEI